MTNQDELVEKMAEIYYEFTVKQGWKLAGFEYDIRIKSREFANQLITELSLVQLDDTDGEFVYLPAKGGADNDAYYAPGVGMSWERSAGTFAAFYNANYRRVKQ